MQRATVIAAVLLATGCSSAPEIPPVYSESLITNIAPQGNHFFTYTATVNTRQDGPGEGMGGGPRGGRRGPGGGMGGGPGGMDSGPGGMGGGPGRDTQRKMTEDPEKTAMQRLETVLAETGYCPAGWFVIESTFDRGAAKIRGECRAIPEDS